MEKVLFCPLNWGLGHATRCVPLIKHEIEQGNMVVIAADGYPLLFLQKQFPEANFIVSKSYPIRYSKGNSLVWQIAKLLPHLIYRIIKEHYWLATICKKEQIDRVVSDNRFGLWNRNIHSTYITHQVMIKMPPQFRFMEKISYIVHKWIIEKYNECWIPDVENDGGYSGDLSHKFPLPQNAKFIGVLSRFNSMIDIIAEDRFANVIILSGVEPQRTIFENRMIEEYKDNPENSLMIVGKPSPKVTTDYVGNITRFSHIGDEELTKYLKGCKKIVCRAGYSTVMDLVTLGVEHKAVYFPTPGQTEQEYLAQYLRK